MTTTTAPDWRTFVRPLFTPGLSTCIADGRLRLQGVRVAATWVDVVAVRLVEHAIAARRSLVLVTPDAYDMLVPLTAAAVHVSRMLELQSRIGGAPHTDLRVAVVTGRLRLRTAYRQLGVGTAKLFEAVPAATRLPTGEIAVLGAPTRTDWGTLFVARASELRTVRGLDLVIVDLPTYDWASLDEMGVPKIVVGHDPSDPLVQRLRGTLPIFSWDAEDLRQVESVRVDRAGAAALSHVAARLERLARGTNCSATPVSAQSVCDNAWLFWNDVGPMHRAATRSHFGNELADEAHRVFQDLMHLSMPTTEYEALTGTSFRARLRDLRHDEVRARDELSELYLPAVHADLEGLRAAIGHRPPKVDALTERLHMHLARRADVLLVARTAAAAEAYAVYLKAIPGLKKVRVSSLGAVGDEPPADVALLTGLAPRWARHIYVSGIASEIEVLAYSATSQLPVADAFVEAMHVERAISYQRVSAADLARSATKARCWEMLTGERIEVAEDVVGHTVVTTVGPLTMDSAAFPDVPPELWDVDLPTLHSPEAPTAPIETWAWADRRASVRAVRVEFEDGRWAWLGHDATITLFDRARQRADGAEVARIRVGDELVFLDGDARKDVLAKVIEVAKDIPRLAGPAAWVEYWRAALLRGKEQFRTYAAFTEALERHGCEREAQTVRLWVVGVIIGPRDPLDVRRVGEVLDDAPLRDHYRTVYGGIEQFRNAHAQLMQRVGALALQVGPAASTGRIRADEVIDERSGLTASDFQGCIEILAVRRVGETRDVPGVATGRLRQPGEQLSLLANGSH